MPYAILRAEIVGAVMITFENVGMRYGMGAEVLKDVSFTLDRGSFHFLVGPSGAGKTTLLKLLYLAHRPSRGLINFFGRDLMTQERDALPRLRRRIGVVFQDFRLFDHMTAFENVALPLRIQGAKRAQVADHVEELLSWVGLEDRMHARPATLSGGEKQRVAIARAVINKPDLLVADEPTGNVDPEMSRRLMHLFVALNKEGTTTVVATHDDHLVQSIGAPTLKLDKGEMSFMPGGTPIDPGA
ncbi:cell division ATP-binding protein FtsE [Kordiimonas sp.]|uniref:cell division ATP-binding protein FtsE n=1 Tax=Kordiimonas sp. TaxID=1970157 RepID=UPI003A92F793